VESEKVNAPRREKCPENRTGACRLMWGEDGNGTRLITLIQC
jgi:hypothetical protein